MKLGRLFIKIWKHKIINKRITQAISSLKNKLDWVFYIFSTVKLIIFIAFWPITIIHNTLKENHQVGRQLVTVDRSQQRCKKHLFFSISNFFYWIFINNLKKRFYCQKWFLKKLKLILQMNYHLLTTSIGPLITILCQQIILCSILV